MSKKEKEYTEIVCIIDRSGSMEVIKENTIESFNTFLKEQKEQSGKATLTYIQFDTEYEVTHENLPLKVVPELNTNTFVPRGMTALLDAIGKAIGNLDRRMQNIPKKKRPKVIVVILTDGQENASKEFKQDQIKELILNKKNKYDWDFIFLAANQDAFAEANKMGINSVDTFAYGYGMSGSTIGTVFTSAKNLVFNKRTK